MVTENKLILPRVKKDTDVLRHTLKESNWRLLTYVFIVTLIGIIMIYSSTVFSGSTVYVKKQVFAFLLSIIFLFLFSVVNYQLFQPYYMYLYGFCIFLLILVLLVGTPYRNTRAWIDLKIFSLQISEIVKILFILSLAGLLDKDYTRNQRITRLIQVAILFGLISFLLILQPDFSAIVIYSPIIVVMLYLSGINRKILSYLLLFIFSTVILVLLKISLLIKEKMKVSVVMKFIDNSLNGFTIQYLVILLLIGLLSWFVWWILRKLLFRVKITHLFLTIFVLWSSYTLVSFSHKFVKLYQQKRLIALLDPYFDPTGAGYQIIQTRIAIGSGRIFGKGVFGSTQARLGFVPEKHTDFIFSVICEELGLVGSTVVIILYFLIILEGIKIIFTARDTYGVLVSSSIVAMFTFYFVVNIGMCLGIFPVIGIPLPFVSYGGSNLISSYIAIGLLNSIYIRRYIY